MSYRFVYVHQQQKYLHVFYIAAEAWYLFALYIILIYTCHSIGSLGYCKRVAIWFIWFKSLRTISDEIIILSIFDAFYATLKLLKFAVCCQLGWHRVWNSPRSEASSEQEVACICITIVTLLHVVHCVSNQNILHCIIIITLGY